MWRWYDAGIIPHSFIGMKHIKGSVVGIAFVLAVSFAGTAHADTVTAADVIGQINAQRVSHGLPRLTENPVLDAAATYKANDEAMNGYFAHISPTGQSAYDIMKMDGYDYAYAGENLSVGYPNGTYSIVQAWMQSPEHRGNILDENFTETGVGVAEGTYKGVQTHFVVQFFGETLESFNEQVAAMNPPEPAPEPHRSLVDLIPPNKNATVIKPTIPIDTPKIEFATSTPQPAESAGNYIQLAIYGTVFTFFLFMVFFV